ncbi:hypothetical protein [Gimesia panareensis]|nr:hypothetical protein [Gimesia panareensis]
MATPLSIAGTLFVIRYFYLRQAVPQTGQPQQLNLETHNRLNPDTGIVS